VGKKEQGDMLKVLMMKCIIIIDTKFCRVFPSPLEESSTSIADSKVCGVKLNIV